jgi:hypothetical protein
MRCPRHGFIPNSRLAAPDGGYPTYGRQVSRKLTKRGGCGFRRNTAPFCAMSAEAGRNTQKLIRKIDSFQGDFA